MNVWLQFCAALILLVASISDAAAWGHRGHRVIGIIADGRLQPEIKASIIAKFNITNLADVASWADRTRKKRRHESSWHYVNVEEGRWTYNAARDCPKGTCVTEKIREFADILADPSASLRERKDALKFLVHFVGDVHQPLHLGNRKDRGGRTFRVRYKGKVANLHSLWDGGLINWRGESPRVGAKNLFKYAARLNEEVSAEKVSDWCLSTISDWANESRSLALKEVYNVDGDLSKAYIKRGREIINLRLTQAGIRLAHLLNTALTF